MNLGIRVYELAKELKLPGKALIEQCQKLGIAVTTHMNSLSSEDEGRVREAVGAVSARSAKATGQAVAKKAAPAKKTSPRTTAAKKAAPAKKTSSKAPTKTKAAKPGKTAAKPKAAESAGHRSKGKEVRPTETRAAAPKPRKPHKPKAISEEVRKRLTKGNILTGQAKIGHIDIEELSKRSTKRDVFRKMGIEELLRKKQRQPQDDSAPRRSSRRRRPGRTTTDQTRTRGGARRVAPPPKVVTRPSKVTLQLPITVKELSAALGVKASSIISNLMRNGVMANINQILDVEMVEGIAAEFAVEVEFKAGVDFEADLKAILERVQDPADLELRAPVVTFLGHVDHGKTTLLDAIRKTHVAAGEAGGITQHIGAYKVSAGGKEVVFLDTPGHEAFTEMRARGANVTDLVVLVVAADDGVMPQTEEAINHARAAGVPIVVAVNKVDKPNADPLRTRQQLARLGLNPEEWGGDTVFVDVSGITGKGLDDLVEMLALEADLLELKANRKQPPLGVVLEARMAPGRGPMATLLVKDGTLQRGDVLLAGSNWGRVREVYDDNMQPVSSAVATTPVSVTGFDQPPRAGDAFYVLDDIQKARSIAEERGRRARMASLAERRHVTLENLYSRIAEGEVQSFNLILKTDVQGSCEVLQKSIMKLSTDEVQVHILHSGVGGINRSDVTLADASDAIIVGFNVVADERARALAEEDGVQIKLYRVIYNVTDSIHDAMEGMLKPEEVEEVIGQMKVIRVFKASRLGTIAGGAVTQGRITRAAHVRLIRDNVVTYEGKIASLRRHKDDVRDVREGFECGLRIEGYDDIKVDDVIEAFEIRQVARKL